MIDPKIVDEVKAANPGVRLTMLRVAAAGGEAEIIVRSPTPAIYRKMKAKGKDERSALDANETFVRDCLAWPDPKAYSALVEQYPGINDTFANRLADLALAVKESEVVPL